MAGGPLEGVRILDLSQVIVGPFASQILADHGADVIRVESKTGDLMRNMAGESKTPGMGAKFINLNRNKRSIALDLKHPDGHAAVCRLIERADVLLWNFRPKAMQRLRFGYDQVKLLNPRIIYCGVVGFGQGGRYRDKRAYDASIQGAAGLAALAHRSIGEPRFIPMSMADRVVGLITVQMVSMALFQRERNGQGCSIQIPMFENMVKFVIEDQMYLKTFEPPLGGPGDPRALHPLGKPTPTKDGWICPSPNTNEQVFAYFDLIGCPELKDDPRFSSVKARFANIDAFFKIREESLKAKTNAEWLEAFDKAGVPCMPYNSLEGLFEDPHLKDVGFFQVKEHPTEGAVRTTRLPNEWSSQQRSDWLPPPKLGQQTAEVLREIGYAHWKIEDMIASGAAVDGKLDGKHHAI